mmetsp:Transcript_113488/g.169781  ORF Transcript_113488/g.169781 Transcript_113488/m.169781 type:complete len:796 (+) Transcript_113488:101-2488(+)
MLRVHQFAADLYGYLFDGGRNLSESEFGVHITYNDLYNSVVFLTAIYVSGQVASRFLRMPNLVGEIVCGIVLGPPLLDFVPNPEAWVLIGELGLILLVVEAGIDIDLGTLKLIGTRGFLIAFFGSILPIGLGVLLAWMMNVSDVKGTIAAGAVFGPTSLGIALNILRSGGILNTPVGQLIVSAAVIDDMIALVVLSQLEALVGDITVAGILVPVVSAMAFLIIGGYVAIFVVPPFLSRYVLSKFDEDNHDKIEMTIMFLLLIGLMPATYYGKASYLMGGFIAGLAFCSSHGVHTMFVRQFKRVLQWLMRIFFAASIGFQVPIKDFGQGVVIWQGLVFCFALLGKLGVGFLVPNFTQSSKFTGNHLRDCLITGFSMAAEGEFAFVIAVFAVDQGLIDKDLYASVVLAVLLSTIIPPFLLRFTISYYNKKGEEAVEKAAMEEEKRKHDLDATVGSAESVDASLVAGIKNSTTVFLCIQTQSDAKWGLLSSLMRCMANQGLDVIDHRAWSPRGIHTTLVNEVYARASLDIKSSENSQIALERLIESIKTALDKIFTGDDRAKVKVQRWFPGVVEEIVEEVSEKTAASVTQRLLKEASFALDRKQKIQTTATEAKSVQDILGGDVESGAQPPEAPSEPEKPAVRFSAGLAGVPEGEAAKPRRRVRHKTRSTPVVGGGLFGEAIEAKSGRERRISDLTKKQDDLNFSAPKSQGIPAEISVKGETFRIRINRETLRDLQRGAEGQMVDSRGIAISGVSISASDDAPVVQRLQGFVRTSMLQNIKEEPMDDVSESDMNSSTA